MLKEQKGEIVEKLASLLSGASLVIATEYKGLTAADMTQLRRRLREQGIDYHVVKNTLARLAAERAGKEGLKDLLQGPIALALGYQEETAPAKALLDYLRTSRINLKIRGGLLRDRVLVAEEVGLLAILPSRQTLAARLAGQMKSPLYSLVLVLNAPLRGLMTVLQGRIQQLERSENA